MTSIPKLTDLEMKIMRVLWENAEPLTIQGITELLSKEKLSVQSVTQSIKHLVVKGAVQVCGHVLVSNVYARTFFACFGQEEYMATEIRRLSNSIFSKKSLSMTSLMAALFENSDSKVMNEEDIAEIQRMIDKKKEQIQGGA